VQAVAETLAGSANTTGSLAAQLAGSIKKSSRDGSTVAEAKALPAHPAPGGRSPSTSKKDIARGVFALAMLLAGMTVASRIPRLVKLGLWHGVAGGIFILTAATYVCFIPEQAGKNLASALSWIPFVAAGGAWLRWPWSLRRLVCS